MDELTKGISWVLISIISAIVLFCIYFRKFVASLLSGTFAGTWMGASVGIEREKIEHQRRKDAREQAKLARAQKNQAQDPKATED